MKNTILTIIVCVFSLSVFAQATRITDKDFRVSGKLKYLATDGDLESAANLSESGLYFSISMSSGSPRVRIYYPKTQEEEAAMTFTDAYLYKTSEGGYVIKDFSQIYAMFVELDGFWAIMFYGSANDY